MKLWMKSLSLLLVILSTLSPNLLYGAAEEEAGVEAPSAKRRRLMIPGEEALEDIPRLMEYAEFSGRQRSRLEDGGSGFTRSHSLRFVESVDDLAVGYGLLPEEGAAIPTLTLQAETYQQLREIGVAVKVLLGYLKSESDLTPDGINVLVPYVSCVVQTADKDPELRPLGFLREAPDEPAIVLLSANQGNGYKGDITRFFNLMYRDEALPEIKAIDAEEVGDAYIPLVLKDWVKDTSWNRLEPFTVKYVAEKVVNGRIMSEYPYVKDANTDQQRNQNTIHFIARCLQFLLQENWSETLRLNYHTVSQLHKASPALPAKENVDDFKAFVQTNKSPLIKAALRRIRAAAEHLDQTKKVELQRIVDYVEVCTFPEEKLHTPEQCAAFWGLIKELNALTCVNPDSRFNPDGQWGVTVEQRLHKHFGNGYTSTHTEQLLVKFLRSSPDMLVQNLRAEEGDEDLQFLGFVIDNFSWLDVCSRCSEFLHTNPIWIETLTETQPLIAEKGFAVPVLPMDSVFRFVSQHEYDGAPFNLRGAGGGADYGASGWDFRFLSRERVSLGARFGWRSLSTRDRVIERIQSRLMRAAVSEPFDFWLGNRELLSVIIKLSESREFFLNAIQAVQLRNPDQKVLRLGLAYLEESRRLELLQSVVETPADWSDVDKGWVGEFDSSLYAEPQKYAAAYYGSAVLKRAKEQYAECKEYLCRFARYCLVYNEGDLPGALDFNTAVDRIIQYWDAERFKASYRNRGFVPIRRYEEGHEKYSTPEEVDGPNMRGVIEMLWDLAHKEEYIESLSEEERTDLRDKLVLLNKPEWVTALLAEREDGEEEVDEAA